MYYYLTYARTFLLMYIPMKSKTDKTKQNKTK